MRFGTKTREFCRRSAALATPVPLFHGVKANWRSEFADTRI